VPDLVFYDGDCGFCHRSVRFLLARDPGGEAFRFAPLQGETFRANVPETERRSLPESLVVHAADGRLLARSEAVVHLLRRLGGAWALLARLLALVPRRLRDLAYDGFAAIRHRLFRQPDGSCPVLPPALRARFDP
jgi:predicted DCC family thiol-disulfide oxidoreductase YuxK